MSSDPTDVEETRRTVVAAWCRSVAEARKDGGWAALEVTAWAATLPPDQQWEAVLAMVAQAEDDDTLGRIAAGPLERLLTAHGAEVIDRLEQQAGADPRFARMLTNLWQPGLHDALTDRIRALQATVSDPLTLTPLDPAEADELARTMAEFDALILAEREHADRDGDAPPAPTAGPPAD